MKPAVYDFSQGRSWTRDAFDAMVGGAVATLHARLADPQGIRVAALSKNSAELLALMLACFRVGAIFVPLNWRLNKRELVVLINDCKPALIFAQSEFGSLLEGVTPNWLPLDKGFNDAPLVDALPEHNQQLAMLLYTSGTSGRPKGVMLTLSNLRAASENFRRVADVRPESNLLCDAPMFHTIGLIAICHTAITVGASVYISPGFVAEATVARIGDERYGITHYFTVPQVAKLMLQAPNFVSAKFKNLRALFMGGAPLSNEMIATWKQHGVTLINGYGSSEAGTAIHMSLEDAHGLANKIGSIGVPVPNIEVSLHDHDGQQVAVGEVGEIWLRGPSLTSGYWGLAAETQQAFSAGWFRSGDAAYQDAQGYYFLVDRWKDMYISGGENVYPAEVENVIAQLAGVAEVAVVGRADPNWGEVGAAFIVLTPGAQLSAEQVIQHTRNNLATYKAPKQVQFIAALPRTGSGKVKKFDLPRA